MTMPFTGPKADAREDLVRAGDHSALAALLEENREPLHRWVEQRLDRRLQGRVSASDIVQDVYIDAEHRLEHFGRLGETPFGVWVRSCSRVRGWSISTDGTSWPGGGTRNARCRWMRELARRSWRPGWWVT